MIDEAKIYFKAGDGGDGCTSFRREKFVEFGGPDGGNGGRGASIILVASTDLNTLLYFRYRQHIKADNGLPGRKMQRTGASGTDIVVKVPIGTQVLDEENSVIADLDTPDKTFIVVRGGIGGAGNINYKTSTNQAPRYSTSGKVGEEKTLWLKLKIISDVGIIGLPNAGKSSFLIRCSKAKSKVADYPFTTLEPHLGVATIDGQEIVMADIPGLIADAHLGVGLGHKFLRHIERCKALLHLIDCTQKNIIETYQCVRNEMMMYNTSLLEKPEIVVLSKCDLVPKLVEKKQQKLSDFIGKPVSLLSIHHNLDSILRQLRKTTAPKDGEKKKFVFDPFNGIVK